jgi:hypothetical protein
MFGNTTVEPVDFATFRRSGLSGTSPKAIFLFAPESIQARVGTISALSYLKKKTARAYVAQKRE